MDAIITPADDLQGLTLQMHKVQKSWKLKRLTWLAYAATMRLLKQHYEDLLNAERQEAIAAWRKERDTEQLQLL